MKSIVIGKQAEVLNVLLEDVLSGHPVSDRKLKEVLGHTPIQVSCPDTANFSSAISFPSWRPSSSQCFARCNIGYPPEAEEWSFDLEIRGLLPHAGRQLLLSATLAKAAHVIEMLSFGKAGKEERTLAPSKNTGYSIVRACDRPRCMERTVRNKSDK